MENEHKYDDIINLPYPRQTSRPRMSAIERAAQFSPFAALVGHDEAIAETARLTDSKVILTEDEENTLNDRIAFLSEILPECPLVGVTYFVRDKKKDGGAYFTKIGNARRVDEIGRKIIFTDGTVIPLDDMVSIEGEVFEEINE